MSADTKTLRDEFAMAAMAAMAQSVYSNAEMYKIIEGMAAAELTNMEGYIGICANEIADYMMASRKERDKTGGPSIACSSE